MNKKKNELSIDDVIDSFDEMENILNEADNQVNLRKDNLKNIYLGNNQNHFIGEEFNKTNSTDLASKTNSTGIINSTNETINSETNINSQKEVESTMNKKRVSNPLTVKDGFSFSIKESEMLNKTIERLTDRRSAPTKSEVIRAGLQLFFRLGNKEAWDEICNLENVKQSKKIKK